MKDPIIEEEGTWMLFSPKSKRGLKADYPELFSYEEFKSLKASYLLFVWYFACKASPLFNLNILERDVIYKCTEAAGLKFNTNQLREQFISGDFPEKVKKAINLMKTFEPSVRILARKKAIKAVLDIKKLTSLVLDDNGNHDSFKNKDKEYDFAKKEKYMKMLFESNSEKMDNLIYKAEHGYGVTNIKESDVLNKNLDHTGETFATSFHNQ